MKLIRTSATIILCLVFVACQSKHTGDESKAKAKAVNPPASKPAAHKPGHKPGGAKPVGRLPSRLPPPSFIENTGRIKEPRAAVTLTVTDKSWRGKQPYAVAAELTKRLRHAGVDVTTDASLAWASVTIRYVEKRGAKRTGAPRKDDSDTHETKIELDVTVTPLAHPDGANKNKNKNKKRRRRARLKLRVQTGKTVVQSMYRSALDALRMSPEYQVLPAWIGAAAGHRGSRRAIARLYLKPVNSKLLLASLGYRAETDEERAYKLIASDKFDACVKLGAPALPALAHFIGAKWGAKKDPARIVRATEAIVRIDGARSEETLVTLLAQALATFQRQPRATTLRLLEAVAARPSLASLPVVALLERHWSPTIAKAATAARTKILSGLALKGTSGVYVATYRHNEAPKVLDVAPLLAAALKNAGIEPTKDAATASKIIIARNTAVAVLDVATGRITGPMTPRNASVRGFARSGWYRGLDSFIGCSVAPRTACKVPAALEALLTDPSNSWIAPGLMKAAGYTPPGQPDADFLLAASGDMAPLETLGPRGAIAIDRILRHRSRYVPDLALLRKATAALVRMNARDHSERIIISARALVVRMHRGEAEPELETTVVELINAFGQIGKARWIHRLRELARNNSSDVRRAALKAQAAIRARVD